MRETVIKKLKDQGKIFSNAEVESFRKLGKKVSKLTVKKALYNKEFADGLKLSLRQAKQGKIRKIDSLKQLR